MTLYTVEIAHSGLGSKHDIETTTIQAPSDDAARQLAAVMYPGARSVTITGLARAEARAAR